METNKIIFKINQLKAKRKKAGCDDKHENYTYTDGYFDALDDIIKIIETK